MSDLKPDTELVRIVHMDGDDYQTTVDAANDDGGSTGAVTEYLAQWDTGDEHDQAAAHNGGLTTLRTLQAQPHQLHEALVDDLHYWLQVDHGLRFYALYREPLPASEAAAAAAERCPNDVRVIRDTDGFCPAHGWDCDDFSQYLESEDR